MSHFLYSFSAATTEKTQRESAGRTRNHHKTGSRTALFIHFVLFGGRASLCSSGTCYVDQDALELTASTSQMLGLKAWPQDGPLAHFPKNVIEILVLSSGFL